MLGLNYVDGIILLILIYRIVRGYYAGFLLLFGRLISFVAALLVAMATYSFIGTLISHNFSISSLYSYGLGYIIAFFVTQLIINFFVSSLLEIIPERVRAHAINRIAGIIPGFVDGLILVSLLLLVLLISPTPESLRNTIHNSKIAHSIADNVSNVERSLNKSFGGVFDKTLSKLTSESEAEGNVSIPYKPTTLSVDPEAEQKMLQLVNAERAKVGAPQLVMDETIVMVARAHSEDMWKRQYFSHIDPDGNDPFARMRAGGAEFLRAGENIALAPNVEIAHTGLMNSPGHKRNILDPTFRRVGIGVVSGGIYGEMFTQDFSD